MGGVIGTAIVYSLVPRHLKDNISICTTLDPDVEFVSVSFLFLSNPNSLFIEFFVIQQFSKAIFLEILLSFFLSYSLLGLYADKKTTVQRWGQLYAFSLLAITLGGGRWTGASVNPMRRFFFFFFSN